MRLNINGIEWHECFYCGYWTHKLICECREGSKSKEALRILEIFRKKYNCFVFISTHGKEKNGMSNFGIDISKFILKGNNTPGRRPIF